MLTSRFLRKPLAILFLAGSALAIHAAANAADAPQVELLIRGSADFRTHYDYVTWAPAPAVIRIVPGTLPAGSAPVTVVLTNAGPAIQGSGHVNFSADAAAYKAALDGDKPDLDSITLTLQADGTPQRLVVAGAFPYFSRKDKDAAIAIHQGSAEGPVIGTTRLMVRVRRNEEEMSLEEKQRFLWALAALRFRKQAGESLTEFDFMVHMHDVGARGYSPNPTPSSYPDQEHKAEGFLPWHRAFLLELERDLQEIDPSVTLPYWPMYITPGGEPAAVFHSDFTGANTALPDFRKNVPDVVRFDPGNPLYGWDIGGQGPLMRWSEDRKSVAAFTKPGDLIDENRTNPLKGRYAFAAGSIESNPHNIGHGWSGIWMSNCSISPSDPMFWPFHTYFDWLWAAWQQNYGRLNRDGKDKADYWPNDSYQEGSPVPLGHHLHDTMWPWNGEVQPKPNDRPFNSRRPQERVGGKFAPAGAPGLWPAQETQPTPADMIDYGGYADAGDDTGAAYDNIPWSPKQKRPPFPGDSTSDAKALSTLLDGKQDAKARSAAAAHIDLAEASDADKLRSLETMAQNAHNPAPLRLAALEVLTRVDTPAAVETAYRMEPDGNATLRDAIEEVRHMRMFANRALDLPPQPAKAAPAGKAANGINTELYSDGRNYVPDNRVCIVANMTKALSDFLDKPHDVPAVWPQDAVAFIAATNTLAPPRDEHAGMDMGEEPCKDKSNKFSREDTLAVLRRLIAAEPVPKTIKTSIVDWWQAKGLAALALAWDNSAASVQAAEQLARDTKAPLATRVMALNGLRGNAPARFEELAFAWAGDDKADRMLRAHAIASIGAYATDKGVTMAPEERDRLLKKLAALPKLPSEAEAARDTAKRLIELANR